MKKVRVACLAAGIGLGVLLLLSGCKPGIIDVVNSPDIRIKVGAAAVDQNGQYDIGAVSSFPHDVTCTIENAGLADLTLSGTPRVALSGSAAFTVSQQPVSPIAPGSSTTFTVRFSPSDMAAHGATV